MVRVVDELALSPDEVSLYYTTDVLLGNQPILVFHGPSTKTNSTQNSSRIQIHVFTAAGFQSYPRITIAPSSPFYESVSHLPRDRQGDELCRGLAFGILKYFRELPENVKAGLIIQNVNSRTKRPASPPPLFAEQHAADLAAAMVKVENMEEILDDVRAALRPQNINHMDIDLVLPPGSITPFQEPDPEEEELEEDLLMDPTLRQHGEYAPLVKLFGDVAFLPTSKLKRAPSRPTSLSRTRSFLKEQKMSLRREMGELVDTEERYVIKMHELVNHIADDFRVKAKKRAFGSFSPSEQDLQKLFPKCLDRILSINSAFLVQIKKVMDETEEEAMKDLEAPIVTSTGSRHGGTGRLKDPTGALAFAKILLEWFPQFSDCYQEYIRASQEFPQIISSFLKQPSSFSQRVHETGEQRLRSAIIEPVQRLPRYSLFIDNIVNFLPVLHPALQPMLKARDLITSICSLDPPATDKSTIVTRLRNLIDGWPPSLVPRGRLITAVDFVELTPPYLINSLTKADTHNKGMFLLFPDCIALVRKAKDCSLSARGLAAEVDKPSAAVMMASAQAAASGQKKSFELAFYGWHSLCEARFTMADDGHSISMASLHELKDSESVKERGAQAMTVRQFVLQAAYEGKASKFTEEITKAKIEGRFSEKERESDRWRLRSIKLPDVDLTLHTAVFEEGVDALVEGRKEPAPIRITVDYAKGTKGSPVGHYGVEIVVDVTTSSNCSKFRLATAGLNNAFFSDDVTSDLLLPALLKRVNDLMHIQFNISNPALMASLISFHQKILKSVHILQEGEKMKTFRPNSPVKMFSTFLSGGFSSSTSSLGTPNVLQKHPRTPQLGNIPSIGTPLTRTNSNKSNHSFQDTEAKGSIRTPADDRLVNPLVRLEETFTAYIAALQSRKGNVVGRVLRNRAGADELAINAIYNTFIENPRDQRAASEESVDVLFVAFEKYLRMAWREQMGPVMPLHTLETLQEKAVKVYPGDFAEFVKTVFGEMAPQNRRAFISIVKLLADLLEGCGNDGDRGALTVAFAELLVVEGNPHDYINLLDRMVEDQDRLFDDIGPGAVPSSRDGSSSAYSSVNGHRSTHSATGSLTSNASSLRKRFTDTLLRQNSSREERPSVWRTLSKSRGNTISGDQPPPSSFSKGSAHRSKSIESTHRRPISRDRPTVLGAFEFDDRPSSSHAQAPRLSTIGASPPPEDKEFQKKKKRRSSLSDLKNMMAATSLAGSPRSTSPERKEKETKVSSRPEPPRKNSLKEPVKKDLPKLPRKASIPASPKTPSPTRIPVATGGGSIMDRGRGLMYRAESPNRENISPMFSTPPTRNIGSLTERPQNIMSPDVPIFRDIFPSSNTPKGTPKGHSKTMSLSSNIPTLRGRVPSISRPVTSHGNSNASVNVNGNGTKSSPQKLRLQNSAKLRERLNLESEAINAANDSIQSELSKISRDMARVSEPNGNGTTSSSPDQSPTQSPTPTMQSIAKAVTRLESRIPVLIKDLTARNEAIGIEIEKSLQASEAKAKGLDQLFKESTAENELLYEKFNGELGKIVKAIKGKGREDREELVEKLREAGEEAGRIRRENSRLKKEINTLRSMLNGHGLMS